MRSKVFVMYIVNSTSFEILSEVTQSQDENQRRGHSSKAPAGLHLLQKIFKVGKSP